MVSRLRPCALHMLAWIGTAITRRLIDMYSHRARCTRDPSKFHLGVLFTKLISTTNLITPRHVDRSINTQLAVVTQPRMELHPRVLFLDRVAVQI